MHFRRWRTNAPINEASVVRLVNDVLATYEPITPHKVLVLVHTDGMIDSRWTHTHSLSLDLDSVFVSMNQTHYGGHAIFKGTPVDRSHA